MKSRRTLQVLGIISVSIVICYFIFRNTLLLHAFTYVKQRINETYHAELEAKNIRFSGLDHIAISMLTLKPDNADTLLIANNIELNLSLLDIIRGKIAFDEIKADGAAINIVRTSDNDNISFLKHSGRPQQSSADVSPKTSYFDLAYNAKAKLFRLFNTPFSIKNVQLTYRDSSLAENIYFPDLENSLDNISGLVINRQGNDTLSLGIKVLSKNKNYLFSLEHLAKNQSYVPFLDREDGLRCRIRSITADLKFDTHGDELEITTDININDFQIQHWRLAKENVIIPSAQFKGIFRISDDALEMDSISTATINSLPLKLFASYSRKPESVFALNIHMPETVSDTFFRSLPAGMFNTLSGISCSGTLSYDLQFSINTAIPDSLIFESTLKRKDFRILHFGADNYARINEPFIHSVYDKDKLVRQIDVGPNNLWFALLPQISQYLPKCIMQSEDPAFMVHRGFIPQAFRESIAQNYKEKRFARGGSTSTMQLVKNVFLNRNKTVSRKVEEALIVYLIENLQLVSKDRMLEVYLNIIEWGPNIYGIGEASRFYFNKKPSDLNLQECIFLAAIIPNPKYFKYQFDRDGHLKSYLADYFKVLSTRMAGQGWISQADTTNLQPNVTLKGPALRMISPADSSLPVDLDLPPVDE